MKKTADTAIAGLTNLLLTQTEVDELVVIVSIQLERAMDMGDKPSITKLEMWLRELRA